MWVLFLETHDSCGSSGQSSLIPSVCLVQTTTYYQRSAFSSDFMWILTGRLWFRRHSRFQQTFLLYESQKPVFASRSQLLHCSLCFWCVDLWKYPSSEGVRQLHVRLQILDRYLGNTMRRKKITETNWTLALLPFVAAWFIVWRRILIVIDVLQVACDLFMFWLYRTGVSNMRPAGQKWPARGSNPALVKIMGKTLSVNLK